VLPVLWEDDSTTVTVPSNGCLESDFDQYGDMEAFGVHPDWQRQMSKFASVQDRLREWKPDVMARLQNFACMAITALDLDAIRLDKATQVTVDALSNWTTAARDCASKHGKTNFLITGEVTGGDTFGALYYGRGRTVTQQPPNFQTAFNLTNTSSGYFMRDPGQRGLDGVAFHYSIYRTLTRYLGMDGNTQVSFDVPTDLVDAWNAMAVSNDLINQATGEYDPRHMFGVSNFDIFRWPSLVSGVQKAAFAQFVTTLMMPGIALIFYGEEQGFYLYDTSASNYLYGLVSAMIDVSNVLTPSQSSSHVLKYGLAASRLLPPRLRPVLPLPAEGCSHCMPGRLELAGPLRPNH
jgi:alpha-1,3-glucan synthase